MARRVGVLEMLDTAVRVSYDLDRAYPTAAMRDWLNDPERPGTWQLMVETSVYPGTATFFISDPNVAFAFKMRWG